MGTFLAVSLALLVPATFVAFAVAIYRERRLAAYLERAHPGVWAEIAPLPGANASVSSPFSRFVQQRRYLKLGDPQASELGDRTRKAFYRGHAVLCVAGGRPGSQRFERLDMRPRGKVPRTASTGRQRKSCVGALPPLTKQPARRRAVGESSYRGASFLERNLVVRETVVGRGG